MKLRLNDRFALGIDVVESETGELEFAMRWKNTGIATPPVITLLENFLRKLKEEYEYRFDSEFGDISG